MKDILVIAHFVDEAISMGNSRFSYIINELIKNDVNVELITSDFSHEKKRKKNLKYYKDTCGYKVTLLDEPLYKKNISIKRIYSHKIISKNLMKYLKSRKKPDVIYCAVPSLNIAEVAANYAKQNNIKFIIDVQDLWPEAFKMVFNIPIISNLIYYPMKLKADRIYKSADNIVAVSDTYANRALSVNNNVKKATTVFLGTELEKFDRISGYSEICKDEETFKIAYVGTLGHSYNIKCIIDSLEIISNNGVKDIEFIVMGDGPLESEFKEYSKNKGIKVKFMGRLEYSKMIKELVKCDIAVNPINKGAAQSIINKVADYAAAGLPVVSTQECDEYINLINRYKIGYSCDNNDINDITSKILMLYKDKELRNIFGKNNRKLAKEKFDRKKTYLKIIKDILC